MKYIDYRETRTQGTFNFPIAYYHLTPHSPRYLMPYHWHTHYELIRVLSGALHLTLDNETAVYRSGDVVFISDGVLHGGTPQDGCIYECVVFDMSILLKDNHACARTIRDIIDRKMRINTVISENCPDILPIMSGLCDALAGGEAGYEFMTQGYLYQILGIIIRNHLYEERRGNSVGSERLDSIKRVLDYIEQNYSDTVSLDMLAKVAGMNVRYLCRYFRSVTDRTPIDYLNYYRIECACEMLAARDLTIKQTAFSCGFNDESYFIRTFQKYKGVTPKQFINTLF